eukprot:GGOE01020664.1.p1 GENE.GGOE01020664.1~~GGOE01020664.1.p1  ORF type:complete len:711 (+),score=122.34 GGOE01020664.1:62-2194(+)
MAVSGTVEVPDAASVRNRIALFEGMTSDLSANAEAVLTIHQQSSPSKEPAQESIAPSTLPQTELSGDNYLPSSPDVSHIMSNTHEVSVPVTTDFGSVPPFPDITDPNYRQCQRVSAQHGSCGYGALPGRDFCQLHACPVCGAEKVSTSLACIEHASIMLEDPVPMPVPPIAALVPPPVVATDVDLQSLRLLMDPIDELPEDIASSPVTQTLPAMEVGTTSPSLASPSGLGSPQRHQMSRTPLIPVPLPTAAPDLLFPKPFHNAVPEPHPTSPSSHPPPSNAVPYPVRASQPSSSFSEPPAYFPMPQWAEPEPIISPPISSPSNTAPRQSHLNQRSRSVPDISHILHCPPVEEAEAQRPSTPPPIPGADAKLWQKPQGQGFGLQPTMEVLPSTLTAPPEETGRIPSLLQHTPAHYIYGGDPYIGADTQNSLTEYDAPLAGPATLPPYVLPPAHEEQQGPSPKSHTGQHKAHTAVNPAAWNTPRTLVRSDSGTLIDNDFFLDFWPDLSQYWPDTQLCGDRRSLLAHSILSDGGSPHSWPLPNSASTSSDQSYMLPRPASLPPRVQPTTEGWAKSPGENPYHNNPTTIDSPYISTPPHSNHSPYVAPPAPPNPRCPQSAAANDKNAEPIPPAVAPTAQANHRLPPEPQTMYPQSLRHCWAQKLVAKKMRCQLCGHHILSLHCLCCAQCGVRIHTKCLPQEGPCTAQQERVPLP